VRRSIPLLLGTIGLAAGIRYGRPAYRRMGRQVRDLRERPGLQEAAGIVSAQAGTLVGRARGAVTQRGVASGLNGSRRR
jgi:hypothetical protein